MNVTMIIVSPGSFLCKHACKEDIIKYQEQFLRDGCPLINVSKLTDEEYKNLTLLIAELRLHPHVLAKSFDIKSINENGEREVELTCRKCCTQSSSGVWFWFGKEVCCPSCGLINFVDPFQNTHYSEESFSSQLPDDENIVLCGSGGIYYKLVRKYDMLSSERFVLVDGNKSLHGLTICKKEIHHPDVVLQKELRTVIITTLSFKDEIYDNLRNNYPSVKNVLIPTFDITKDGVVPVLRFLNAG